MCNLLEGGKMHTYSFAVPVKTYSIQSKSNPEYYEFTIDSFNLPDKKVVINHLEFDLRKAKGYQFALISSAIDTVNDSYVLEHETHIVYQNNNVWVKDYGYAPLSVLKD